MRLCCESLPSEIDHGYGIAKEQAIGNAMVHLIAVDHCQGTDLEQVIGKLNGPFIGRVHAQCMIHVTERDRGRVLVNESERAI